jgi:hypothetical protein
MIRETLRILKNTRFKCLKYNEDGEFVVERSVTTESALLSKTP